MMAHKNTQVWLGFDDEFITDKHKNVVNFTTNKIGGNPDWPSKFDIETPKCPLCQLPRPLVIQMYAPLDNSTYHRTLYLFACINPNCWRHAESWICIRIQTLEEVSDIGDCSTAASKSITNVTDWCKDADDWDDNNANPSEENGNIINNAERISDEDEESCSTEDSIRAAFGNLTVDDRNANMGIVAEAQGGAVGRLHSPAATAEIEGDEGEVISIDTPTMPQRDIIALLQEVTPLPQDLCYSDKDRSSILQFVPSFISVWEETCSVPNISDCHVKELLQEYQQKNQDVLNTCVGKNDLEASAMDIPSEKYEKSTPAHGDKMFHHFLSKIQMNPGQMLRYSRESVDPLIMYPLQEVPRQCEYCHGDMVFEFQLLPTIIRKLELLSDVRESTRLEFGTVLVFTCKKSCWSTDLKFQTEVVVLQTEVY